MQKIFFYLFLIPAIVFASETVLPRGLKSCLTKLSAASVTSVRAVELLAQASSIRGLRDSENARLILLESVLQSLGYLEALQDPNGTASKDLKAYINQGASQRFYQSAIELIEKYSPPHALTYILLAKQSLLPSYMPSARNLPIRAIQENPRLTRLLISGLEIIFENNLYMRPVHFTRRVFAYLARQTDLSQSEKYNLTTNLILEFRRQVDALNKQEIEEGRRVKPIKLYSYYRYPEIAEDGTRFICGTSSCNYYFAITSDARFYIVHRENSAAKFDPNAWDQHERVREAIAPQ